MRKRKTYDTKCEELAKYFLHKGASEFLTRELAEHIQSEVEFWFDSESNAIQMDVVRIDVENKA